MKKGCKFYLVFLLLLVALLTACDSKVEEDKDTDKTKNEDKTEVVEKKTCSQSEDGLSVDVTFSAVDDKVEELEMVTTMTPEYIGMDDLKSLSDEDKKKFEDAMLEELKLNDKELEGFEVVIDVDENVVVTYKIDLEKVSDDTLDLIGFDYDGKDLSLKEIIDSSKDEGFTCK